MSVKFSNNAATTLSADISAGATSFTVASASTFPTLASGDWTYVSLTSEVVKVTAISGTTFTCDATSGAHVSGESVELRMTAEILNDVALGDDESLDAISNASAITGNAVDVFIYDTSNDSDGGAWRKRTQATSWYNETLNTSTRGSRKEFPSVAVIVAESNKVTIYDGDTPDLDMWMVFTQAGWNATLIIGTGNTSTSMLNGKLAVGTGPNVQGLVLIDFILDRSQAHLNASNYGGVDRASLALRNTSGHTFSAGTSLGDPTGNIVSNAINDVAMTVLPNAPIDSTTGLPIPTIAVATNGGVSVIKDDGTVVDLTTSQGGTYNTSGFIEFHGEKILFGADSTGSVSHSRRVHYHSVPSGDKVFNVNGITSELYATSATNSSVPDGMGGVQAFHASFFAGGAVGGYYGLNKINHPDNYFAYLTSTYNSGYMTGDIKGAWLSDTDTTNVVGTELVTNGTFTGTGNVTGWTLDPAATNNNGANVLNITTGSTTNVVATQALTLVIGESYVVSFERITGTSSCSINAGLPVLYSSTVGVETRTFVATSTSGTLLLNTGGGGATIIADNISVRLAEEDRSVNNNGLQVNGTITKTAVATGADLVAYSGFSSANYLEQPYNSDLNFGTGDFSVNLWVKVDVSTTAQYLFGRDSATTAQRLGLYVRADGTTIWIVDDNTTDRRAAGTKVIDDGVYHLHTCIYDGLGGLEHYIDGILNASASGTALLTMNNTLATLAVGAYPSGSPAVDGSLALFRISATAPTAAQILEIYEAEKPLFQENAKATLNGTSDAVQCLAYDDSTELLHVGTSGGRSTFQGLRRVDETATNTTEISAQGGMIIEETA